MPANRSKKTRQARPESTVVFTIGHSTRSIEEFIALPQAHGVSCVVDVRWCRDRGIILSSIDSLRDSLKKAGVGYTHLPGLGGLRHAKAGSTTNIGWRNASFRGYADYMQTPEFEQNLEELLGLAETEQVAIMCAEAVPWRCHRSLIGDALLVRGVRVEDIMNLTRRTPHTLTPFAKLRGKAVIYPGEDTISSTT